MLAALLVAPPPSVWPEFLAAAAVLATAALFAWLRTRGGESSAASNLALSPSSGASACPSEVITSYDRMQHSHRHA